MLFHCCSYFMYFQFCGLRFLREKNISAVPHGQPSPAPWLACPVSARK